MLTVAMLANGSYAQPPEQLAPRPTRVSPDSSVLSIPRDGDGPLAKESRYLIEQIDPERTLDVVTGRSTFIALALIPHLGWLIFHYIRPILAIQNRQQTTVRIIAASVVVFYTVALTTVPFVDAYGLAIANTFRVVTWVLLSYCSVRFVFMPAHSPS